MTTEAQAMQGNCTQPNKWEFFKNPEGLWSWRSVAPEGWDQKKGEWSNNSSWQQQQGQQKAGGREEWNQEGTDWVELARSQEGYKSKSECEDNARKHGWK